MTGVVWAVERQKKAQHEERYKEHEWKHTCEGATGERRDTHGSLVSERD